MAVYISIFLSLISIILLICVIIRFKKLFSTESIIEKTKVQMNKIIGDINKNANMDIDLINDATKRTRELMTEADSKMADLREATSILRDMIATVENGIKLRPEQSQIYGNNSHNSYVDDIQSSGQKGVSVSEKESSINNSRGYGSPVSAYRAKAYQTAQYKDAFDDNDLLENKTEPVGNPADANMIPKIVTNIIPNEAGSSKKSLNERVEKLFKAGMQVDDIALELSCSSSEVQFIIDMLVQLDSGL